MPAAPFTKFAMPDRHGLDEAPIRVPLTVLCTSCPRRPAGVGAAGVLGGGPWEHTGAGRLCS
jgi:hypothetical protein